MVRWIRSRCLCAEKSRKAISASASTVVGLTLIAIEASGVACLRMRREADCRRCLPVDLERPSSCAIKSKVRGKSERAIIEVHANAVKKQRSERTAF